MATLQQQTPQATGAPAQPLNMFQQYEADIARLRTIIATDAHPDVRQFIRHLLAVMHSLSHADSLFVAIRHKTFHIDEV